MQADVAAFTLGMSVLTGTLSAITAPRIGSLSDRYGRTRLLVIASCGGVLNELITIFAAKFPDTIDYHWLILGSFFDGITGSFTAGSILSYSYTADCTAPSKRGIFIGYLHACLFTGLAFGPLLAAYFVEWTGSLLSIFYVTLGCHIFFILFILFITPESVSKKRQLLAREKYATEKSANLEQTRARLPQILQPWFGSKGAEFLSNRTGDYIPLLLGANPLAPLKMLAPQGPGKGRLRRNLIVLALIDGVILAAAFGAGTPIILYVSATFGWRTPQASKFVSFTAFIRVIVLLGILPFLTYWFRLRPIAKRRRESGVHQPETNSGADKLDLWLLRVALISDVIGITGYVFARSPAMFVVSGALASFGGMGGAVIQGALSKHVPPDRVGALLGATGLLHSLGRVWAPVLFNGIYWATVATYPQAFLVLLLSIFSVTLVASFFVRPHRKSSIVTPCHSIFGSNQP